VVFVEGALPGEGRRGADLQAGPQVSTSGAATSIANHSPGRREAALLAFSGVCGRLPPTQHADEAHADGRPKQRWLEDCLERIGKRSSPRPCCPSSTARSGGYRHRARGSRCGGWEKEGRACWSASARAALDLHRRHARVFRFCRTRFLRSCPHSEAFWSKAFSVRETPCRKSRVCGRRPTRFALVFRHLPAVDRRRSRRVAVPFMRSMACTSGCSRLARTPRIPFAPRGGATSTTPCRSSGLELHFRPTDFTQVNAAVNRILVSKGGAAPRPQAGRGASPIFSAAIGNFSLPLAKRGAEVIGLEGSRDLVGAGARAQRACERRGGAVRGSPISSRHGLAPFGTLR